jgi:hypothetical protein
MDTNKLANSLFWHAVHILFYGIALHFLWDWFMPPAMHASAIRYGVSFGLVCIFCMMFRKIEGVRAISLQNIAEEALTPVFFTLVGFLIHTFITF